MGPNKKRINSDPSQGAPVKKKAKKSPEDEVAGKPSRQSKSRKKKEQLDLEIKNKSSTLRSNKVKTKKQGSIKHAVNETKPVKDIKEGKGDTANEKVNDRFTFWLMKSEPETRMENGVDVKFGFEDLKACPDQTSYWDGVRNYQARNFMRDQMKIGDKVFFYHSNTKIPGIVGVCSIVKEAYPDHTQFDKKSPYYDPKSEQNNPRWLMVDVKYEYDLKRYIPLHELKELHIEHKASGGPLRNIALFTKARLSVQPVSQEEWDFVIKLSEQAK